jgi:two-component system cell cycle sensor histidine kinase/response regulator CckA
VSRSERFRVVLVVDDEPEILRRVDSILGGAATVIPASGAEDALRRFRASPAPPDLVLSDVVMPGMSGPMMAERMRALIPDQRIAFMSRYDGSQVVRRYVVERGFDLIAKPFDSSALRAFVAKALARKAGGETAPRNPSDLEAGESSAEGDRGSMSVAADGE